MRLTGRGVAVLVAAPVLFAAGQVAGYPLFLAMGSAALGAVVAAAVTTGRRPRVAVTRQVHPDRVEVGRPALAKLRVRNPGGRRQAAFTAGDRLGDGFRSVAVRALAPYAEAVHHYELPTQRRGRHQVGPLTLDRGDPLGLSRRRLTAGGAGTLWVYPRVHAMRAITGGPARHHHEGAVADNALRGSFDLREVREYQPGDEVRHLHWKATARTGRLMVRDYADPDQPRLTTILDTRREAGDPAPFEAAVEVAASLVSAAASADHWCRLGTPCGVDVKTRGGAPAVRRMLDELCVLNPAEDAGLALVPEALRRGWGGGLAVVTTASAPVDRGVFAAVRSWYSRVVVIVLGARASGVRLPGVTVLSAADAAEAAARWNTVVAR
ncbi:DUF58 domain-containing protein [Amycolatopsis anabasis]|uniref:DUF58 domain-containing protein n=1 Tax=Amycolatopsis anabasis TaxID=1840409 RepID=UPI00131C0706|nr:DUF58 domain-containing protein [Amycolatopsis anabasis]